MGGDGEKAMELDVRIVLKSRGNGELKFMFRQSLLIVTNVTAKIYTRENGMRGREETPAKTPFSRGVHRGDTEWGDRGRGKARSPYSSRERWWKSTGHSGREGESGYHPE